MTSELKTNFFALVFAGLALGMALIYGRFVLQDLKHMNRGSRPMLLAPMIGVVEPCLMAKQDTPMTGMSDMSATCTGPTGSAAALIEETLATIEGPKNNPAPDSMYPLGYTLPVPLLQLFKAAPNGWSLDAELISRIANTIHTSNRPLVLYLFSTHFSTNAPLEVELAKDPSNLAQTQDGTLTQGSYYGAPINHWSVSDTNNHITKRREESITGLLKEICELPEIDLKKITAVTLLGELHHFFPDFESGMGFSTRYKITDYSLASRNGFQEYLKSKYFNISRLNAHIGSSFESFTAIHPPNKDIRTEKLNHFTEHIDSYAHGTLPISGWAHVKNKKKHLNPNWVHLYLNDKFIGKTPANRNRQDVLKAHPEYNFADTGWRFDLNFRKLKAGIHKIDVYLETDTPGIQFLGSRKIAVMDRHQNIPSENHARAQNHVANKDLDIAFSIDTPQEKLAVFYNPLVEEWHEFRSIQISRYLSHFDSILKKSCLKNTPAFTHQIIPTSNPGWDENKFGINTLTTTSKEVQPGYSLYGDATVKNYFPIRNIQTSNLQYGITEFHPLRPVSTRQIGEIFDQHRHQGALFLSFFMEPRWRNRLVPRGHNIFSFDPQNKEFASDVLFNSVRDALAKPSQHHIAGKSSE